VIDDMDARDPSRPQRVLDGFRWKSRGLGGFSAMLRDVEARIGAPVERDVEVAGLGPFDYYDLRFACGLEVGLERAQLGRQLQPIDPLVEPSWWGVYAIDRDLEHIAFHLGVAAAALVANCDREGRPVVPPPRHRFVVMRQDDNGNQLPVQAVSSRCEADALAASYEARGHKQTYWVEERP
jgi:hypothetical protein